MIVRSGDGASGTHWRRHHGLGRTFDQNPAARNDSLVHVVERNLVLCLRLLNRRGRRRRSLDAEGMKIAGWGDVGGVKVQEKCRMQDQTGARYRWSGWCPRSQSRRRAACRPPRSASLVRSRTRALPKRVFEPEWRDRVGHLGERDFNLVARVRQIDGRGLARPNGHGLDRLPLIECDRRVHEPGRRPDVRDAGGIGHNLADLDAQVELLDAAAEPRGSATTRSGSLHPDCSGRRPASSARCGRTPRAGARNAWTATGCRGVKSRAFSIAL